MWFKLRITIITLSAIATGGFVLFAPPLPFFSDAPPYIVWSDICAVIFMLVITPFMIAAVISFQSINPLSDQVWTRPSHNINPFRFGNPLPFFHFASYGIMAQGFAMVLTSIIGGWTQFLYGILVVMGGFLGLAGVHLSMRWCKHKMEPEP